MDLKNKKIAVLMGGKSGERDVSLRSGAKAFESLQRQGYNVISVDTAQDNFAQILLNEKIEVAFLALHGKFGEDGTIQGLLEILGISYTGSGVLASALAMNKVAAKRIFDALKIPTPKYVYIKNLSSGEVVKKNFPFPVVIKPTSEGSSIGVSIIKDAKEFDFNLSETIEKHNDVFVEEFISGKEVTVGILGTGSDTLALPILELSPKNEFYDFHAKYTAGMTDFIIPARLPKPLYEYVQETALRAHKSLGCNGVSRVDIIVSDDGVPYVHEVNTIPGLTDLSDLPAQASYAGISYDELIVRILESAKR